MVRAIEARHAGSVGFLLICTMFLELRRPSRSGYLLPWSGWALLSVPFFPSEPRSFQPFHAAAVCHTATACLDVVDVQALEKDAKSSGPMLESIQQAGKMMIGRVCGRQLAGSRRVPQ